MLRRNIPGNFRPDNTKFQRFTLVTSSRLTVLHILMAFNPLYYFIV